MKRIRGNGREAGKGIVLSRRLMAVVSMVEEKSRVCDVGCDHGYVSIALAEWGSCERVIAMDVNRGPLAAAREHIREYGLEGYIETRLSDGLAALLKGEADTLICAGMGGPLIQSILKAGRDVAASMKNLILQPQSGILELREYLREQGYGIVAEDMVYEDGKYYSIIKATPREKDRTAAERRPVVAQEEADGNRPPREKDRTAAVKRETGSATWQETHPAVSQRRRAEDRYGPCLLRQRHPVLLQFLTREMDVVTKNLQCLETCAGPGKRREEQERELKRRLADIRYAFSLYEKEDCL